MGKVICQSSYRQCYTAYMRKISVDTAQKWLNQWRESFTGALDEQARQELLEIAGEAGATWRTLPIPHWALKDASVLSALHETGIDFKRVKFDHLWEPVRYVREAACNRNAPLEVHKVLDEKGVPPINRKRVGHLMMEAISDRAFNTFEILLQLFPDLLKEEIKNPKGSIAQGMLGQAGQHPNDKDVPMLVKAFEHGVPLQAAFQIWPYKSSAIMNEKVARVLSEAQASFLEEQAQGSYPSHRPRL